jgi:hypothetical protein
MQIYVLGVVTRSLKKASEYSNRRVVRQSWGAVPILFDVFDPFVVFDSPESGVPALVF